MFILIPSNFLISVKYIDKNQLDLCNKKALPYEEMHYKYDEKCFKHEDKCPKCKDSKKNKKNKHHRQCDSIIDYFRYMEEEDVYSDISDYEDAEQVYKYDYEDAEEVYKYENISDYEKAAYYGGDKYLNDAINVYKEIDDEYAMQVSYSYEDKDYKDLFLKMNNNKEEA